MIPYDIDPSLHAHEPQNELLSDGFSPPDAAPLLMEAANDPKFPVEPDVPGDMPGTPAPGLGPKSLF